MKAFSTGNTWKLAFIKKLVKGTRDCSFNQNYVKTCLDSKGMPLKGNRANNCWIEVMAPNIKSLDVIGDICPINKSGVDKTKIFKNPALLVPKIFRYEYENIGFDCDWDWICDHPDKWNKFQSKDHDGVIISQSMMYGGIGWKNKLSDAFEDCAWDNRDFVYLLLKY